MNLFWAGLAAASLASACAGCGAGRASPAPTFTLAPGLIGVRTCASFDVQSAMSRQALTLNYMEALWEKALAERTGNYRNPAQVSSDDLTRIAQRVTSMCSKAPDEVFTVMVDRAVRTS